jgi:hypothetical protein
MCTKTFDFLLLRSHGIYEHRTLIFALEVDVGTPRISILGPPLYTEVKPRFEGWGAKISLEIHRMTWSEFWRESDDAVTATERRSQFKKDILS